MMDEDGTAGDEAQSRNKKKPRRQRSDEPEGSDDDMDMGNEGEDTSAGEAEEEAEQPKSTRREYCVSEYSSLLKFLSQNRFQPVQSRRTVDMPSQARCAMRQKKHLRTILVRTPSRVIYKLIHIYQYQYLFSWTGPEHGHFAKGGQ